MPSALIVDDEPDMLLLLRLTIEAANQGLSVAGEATSGDEALTQFRQLHPDVIVLDNRMPGLSGLETAERILSESPDQPIILFSAFLDAALVRSASELGIRACVSKRDVANIPEALWRYATAD